MVLDYLRCFTYNLWIKTEYSSSDDVLSEQKYDFEVATARLAEKVLESALMIFSNFPLSWPKDIHLSGSPDIQCFYAIEIAQDVIPLVLFKPKNDQFL